MLAGSQLMFANRSAITLAGSTEIVRTFFKFSINSILYQRGVYPPEDFKTVKQYNLPMMVAAEDKLSNYIETILNQVEYWLTAKAVQKLVLVILAADSQEVLERWQFEVKLTNDSEDSVPADVTPKTEAQVTTEIQAIMRQITASVTFLPVINERCTFDLLVYANKDAEVPETWKDSDARPILSQSEQVKLRSFATDHHAVETMVAYKLTE